MHPERSKAPADNPAGAFNKIPCGDLLSHTVTHAVPSARRGLTSVFGMGTGVALSALPQRNSQAPGAHSLFAIASSVGDRYIGGCCHPPL